MITGLFVYDTTTVELVTSEAGLVLERMGAHETALARTMSLSPGVYRVRSRTSLGVERVAATVVDVVHGEAEGAWPVPPARALEILKLSADEVAAFFTAAEPPRRKKRALVVGSQTGNLRGVVSDAAAIKSFLEQRGFTVDYRIDMAASRDGILAGYDQLIEQSTEGDVAVFYYSGHGAFVPLPEEKVRSAQHIVPFDYDRSSSDNWCGITAWELSIKQQKLTEKTKNVTVILDCCHSAQMSRDAATRDAVARALPHPNLNGYASHLDALEARYPGVLATLDVRGNPDAVRLVACAQTQSAYEYPNAKGEFRGVFSEALLEIMEAVGSAPITWKALGEAIRARVLPDFPTQRPDIEGPTRRRMFELDQEDEHGATAIHLVEDKHVLSAGKLAGITVGDVYGVMPVGSLVYDKTKALGKVEVVDVLALTSIAKRVESGNVFPVDAVAFPIELRARKRLVELDVPAADRPQVVKAIADIGTLDVAKPGDRGAVATLRLADGKLTITDAKGPLFEPTSFPADLYGTVKNVANLGVAQRMRELEGEAGVAAGEVEIELGVVEAGNHVPLPDHGSALGLGDRVSIRLANRAFRTLHFHVFNVGVRGKVTLLNGFAPSGIAVNGGGSYLLGEEPGVATKGLQLLWPKGLLTDVPRIDEVLVIVTTQPASLTGLETIEFIARGPRGVRGGSKLQDLLAQVQDGQTRDMTGPAPIDGYYAKRLSFVLHPKQVAMGGVKFDIDENPTGMSGARGPDAWAARAMPAAQSPNIPDNIAIRLGDLVVLNNRALFRADVRIDALICTRCEAPYKPQAWTERFKRISDGERLALENVVLFQGPVKEFVDIALFVSRDIDRSVSLSELFAEQTNSAEFREASTALLVGLGLATAAPWVAAVGASAVLTRMAYKLVLGLRGESIGLYRTSFLAGERFGVGRHPIDGLYRAQDFAFSLSIEAV